MFCRITFTATALSIILASFCADACAQDESEGLMGNMYEGVYGYLNEGHARIFGGLMASFGVATPPVKKVSNVPYDLRNVEIHSDDLWYGTPGAIADEDSRAPWMTYVELLRAGAEFDIFDSAVLQLYMNGSWNFGHWLNLGGGRTRGTIPTPRAQTSVAGGRH